MKALLMVSGASIMLASFVSNAQVAVVESVSIEQQQAQEQEQADNVNAELLYQLQLLQEEVLQMRGSLEEQSHQLRQLQQQRLDDYVNLDKRISALSAGAVRRKPVAPVNTPDQQNAVAGTEAVTDTAAVALPSDKDDYKAAYNLIKERQFDAAKEAFNGFLSAHSSSDYVPNAHYWLGELYILDANYASAKTEFATVLSDYPDHRKYPEALLKLAKVNYEMGDRDVAKKQLEQLIEQYAERSENTTRLAREFLNKHYP